MSNWPILVENLVLLRGMRKQLKAMNLSNDHNETGMSRHERIHLMEIIEGSIKRCENILAEDGKREAS